MVTSDIQGSELGFIAVEVVKVWKFRNIKLRNRIRIAMELAQYRKVRKLHSGKIVLIAP